MSAGRILLPTKAIGSFAGALGAGLVLFAPHAGAQNSIGAATVVQNDVRGHTGGEIFKINRGDQVYLDQFVQTSSESRAKFVFLDTTNMSVGPDSVVKLDQFVYNGNGTARAVSIHATKGAFRFFSGSSAHEAYKVTTPQAVIGVRGTTYDVLIAGGQTFVKLQDGAVTACVRTGSTCRDLDRPGQYLIVNDRSIDGPFEGDRNTWDFGSLCTGGAADLCRKTRFAMNDQPPPPSGGQPGQPPRIRTAGLPPASDAPPYAPPPSHQPPRGPVATIDPPLVTPPYLPPSLPPYRAPHRPPHHPPRPPQDGSPGAGKPPQSPPHVRPWPRPDTGRPYPTRPPKQTTDKPPSSPPPSILRQGRTPGRWAQGNPGGPRISQQIRSSQPRMSQPRMFSAPRMTSGPRMNSGPRLASFSGPRRR